jgi:hypothetical protein
MIAILRRNVKRKLYGYTKVLDVRFLDRYDKGRTF